MKNPAPLQILAEVNTSHFGNLENAKSACAVASNSGATGVKFQSWKPQSLYSQRWLDDNRVEARLYEKLSLSEQDLTQLREFAGELGLTFGSTVYSPGEVSHLAEISADFIKIASMDIDNSELLAIAAKSGIPVIISTGMASIDEISWAVNFFSDMGGQDLTVLHCVSLYPTELEESSVGNIRHFTELFPEVNVGFSDHTRGVYAAIAALVYGTRVFEKHLSVDKSKPGFDNAMAQSPEEFREYSSTLRKSLASIQQDRRELSHREIIQKQKLRRSAHYTRDLEPGNRLGQEDVVFLRPGDGILRDSLDTFLGYTLRIPVRQGEKISPDDFFGSE